MKLTDYRGNEIDVETYVSKELDGSDYGGGQLEEIKVTADNCAVYLAKLTALLVTKGVITEEDVGNLL